jgi:NDP-sugar pyrophosphorylase family protein
VLLHLRHHGFTDIVVNLHFLPRVITDYFGNGSRFGLRIDYSCEEDLLGTAGGLKKAEWFFKGEGSFLVHYGDILTNQDFSALQRYHEEKGAAITMLVHERPGSNSVVEFDGGGRIRRFLERPTEEERRGVSSPWVNSGICLCGQSVFDLIPSKGPCDLPRDVFAKNIDRLPLFAFPLCSARFAIDSPERLAKAEEAFAKGALPRYPADPSFSFGTKI